MNATGDIITQVNGRSVNRSADLAAALDEYKLGDQVSKNYASTCCLNSWMFVEAWSSLQQPVTVV